MDGLGELPGLFEVRLGRLAPEQVGVRGVGQAAVDGDLEAAGDAVEALGGPLAGQERRGRARRRRWSAGGALWRRCGRRATVGHVHDVGGEPGGAGGCGGTGGRAPGPCRPCGRTSSRSASWSSKWTAAAARLDHRLHQLEGVERAAEAGLGVGDDRHEVVDARRVPRLCWIWSARRNALLIARTKARRTVAGVEALVGVHLPGQVGVGGDLPAAQVDRLQAGRDHLERLVARDRTQRGDVRLGLEQLPELLRPRRASVDSTCTEPRSRTTSSAV